MSGCCVLAVVGVEWVRRAAHTGGGHERCAPQQSSAGWVGALGQGGSSVSWGPCCLRAAAGPGHNCHCSQEQPWLGASPQLPVLVWAVRGQMWNCVLCTNTSAASGRGRAVADSPGSAAAHISTFAPGLSCPAQRMLPTKISKLPKLQAEACAEVVSFIRSLALVAAVFL